MSRRKRLYSFYCQPCDHAWLAIKDHTVEVKFDSCEFCSAEIKGEIVPDKL